MRPPDEKTPITILGAGIVGICTALSLLERGLPVTLIDRGDPGQETSMGNAGVVSPWSVVPQSLPGTWKSIPKLLLGYGRPLSIHPKTALRMLPWGARFLRNGREERVRQTSDAMSALCGPSIDLYQKHLRGTGHEALITSSIYIHAFRDGSRANLTDLEYRIRAEKGAELELIGRDQLSRLEPALSPAFQAAVLIKGQARIRSPGRLCQVLAEKARALGATFKTAEIKEIRRNGPGWDVATNAEMLRTEHIVMCLGVWSADLLKGISVRIPLMAERGYHVEFANPGIDLDHSVMDVDAKVVASRMEGGVRVAGQAEFAPVDAPPSQRRKHLLIDVAKAAFPSLDVKNPKFWMGRRPSFPDSLPMLGGVEGQPGLILNFGHSHYGLMMAPSSGEQVARLICGDFSNLDITALSPSRF